MENNTEDIVGFTPAEKKIITGSLEEKPEPKATAQKAAHASAHLNKQLIAYEYLEEGLDPEDFFKELEKADEDFKDDFFTVSKYYQTKTDTDKAKKCKDGMEKLKKAKGIALTNQSIDRLDWLYPSDEDDRVEAEEDYGIEGELEEGWIA